MKRILLSLMLIFVVLLPGACTSASLPASETISNPSESLPPASEIALLVPMPTTPVEAVYLASIGGGSAQGQFNHPRGIAVDKSGNVYVVDTEYHRVQVFRPDGSFLHMWGTSGNATGQFSNAKGIALDGAGNVYVADSMNNRIQVFTNDGKFLHAWGSPGTSDGQFNRPSGIAVDDSGDVYVVDSWNGRVQVFNNKGNFLRAWGSPGSNDGQFAAFTGGGPDGIAVDKTGNIYVADTWNNRIQVFSDNGTLLRKWGDFGDDDGQFNTPSGIAMDQAGNILVVSEGMNMGGARIERYASVQRFTPQGKFLQRWGTYGNGGSGPGQFDHPAGIAVDGKGNVLVADSWNNRVQKFSNEGKFLAQWGSVGAGALKGPNGVALDKEGNIYVADSQNDRVQKFSPAGEFLAKWGSKGSGNGQFFIPSGIAVDGQNNVYVADQQNHRVQVFTSTGKFLGKWGSEGGPFGERGKFTGPMKIAVDAEGNVYVADTHSVQKFSPDGRLLEFWPEGMTPEEVGIDIHKPYDREKLLPVLASARAEDLAIDGSGNIYVAESGGLQNEVTIAKYGDNRFSQVRILSPAGQELARWGFRGKGGGGFYQGRIAVDSTGHIFLADPVNNNVQVFNARGDLLGHWGSKGFGDLQFDDPADITVDTTGKVYVADYSNNRIQVFQLRERTETAAPSSPPSSAPPSFPIPRISEYVGYHVSGIPGRTYGWDTTYPRGWLLDKAGSDQATFVLAGEARVDIHQSKTNGIALDLWVNAVLSATDSGTTLSRQSISLTDNISAVDVVREYGDGRKVRTVYFIVDSQAFTIMAQTTSTLWDKLNPAFDHIIGSFTVSKY